MATKPKTQIMSHDDTVMSPITKASNVLFEDGKTAQDKLEDNVEKSFTPSIENSSSMFKVGQGDSVDYSDNVLDGAYEECVLKGRSLVNCIQEPSSKDVILPYEFTEGQHVTIHDTKESGALGVELKGQTLVNLAKVRSKQASNAVGEVNIPIKPNTKYIAFANVTYEDISNLAMFLVSPIYVESTSGLNGDSLYTATVSGKGGTEIRWNQTGVRYVTFTSTSNQCYLHIRTGGSTSNLKYNNMQVFEYQQDMENWDIPYFEGMASVKTPTVKTVGKNLFDVTKAKPRGDAENLIIGKDFLEHYRQNGSAHSRFDVPVSGFKVGKYYKYSANVEFLEVTEGFELNNSLNGYLTGMNYYPTYNHSTGISEGYITAKSQTITFGFHNSNTDGAIRTRWSNIQIEEVESLKSPKTTYESHTSSSLTIPNEVVLRSLPNGVCDTYNTRTGEYVRRILEIVFNGSEDILWSPSGYSSASHYAFFTRSVNGAKNAITKVYCDKLPSIGSLSEAQQNREGCMISSDNRGHGNFWIKLSSQKIENNVSSLKDYLKQNPITIQYELATPIITKFQPQSTLKPHNTTTHIYSEIPENSLYPILSHSNPTYPVMLKPSTKYSIVANSYDNNHTSSAINFNLGGATASATVGNRVTTVTTPSALGNNLLTMSGKGNKLNNVMVIEGDVVGDEPYFEGICDAKSPVVKNYYNTHTLSRAVNEDWGIPSNMNVNISLNPLHYHSCPPINVTSLRQKKVYTGLARDGMVLHTRSNFVVYFDSLGKPLGNRFETKENGFIIPQEATYIRLMNNVGTNQSLNYVERDEYFISTVKFKVGDKIIHKSNTTIFNQEDGQTIVLRSLPNGVCDTLNVETGEYVQRIGECVIDGTQYISVVDSSVNTELYQPYFLSAFGNVKRIGNDDVTVICDKLVTKSRQFAYRSYTENSIAQYIDPSAEFVGVLLKSTLGGLTPRQWFAKNPITIQYELATPIVSIIDVQGFPYAYKDGHVQLSSGYNGQSLTPKVEYSLPVNRNGQIRMNQKMVERHQKQIDKLQAIILANLVNNQYKQTLATLQCELSRV